MEKAQGTGSSALAARMRSAMNDAPGALGPICALCILHCALQSSPKMTQSAVVSMPLEPMAVELRRGVGPEIGDEDVLLAVGAVSVCGSDVHQAYNTHSWPVNVPVTLGHEFGGTIAEAGRAVAADSARVIASSARPRPSSAAPARCAGAGATTSVPRARGSATAWTGRWPST